MKKIVYCLNGMSPDRLMYKSIRKKDNIELKLLDNHGDLYNTGNLLWLCDSGALDNKNAYVILSAELSHYTIANNEKLLGWYQKHYDQFLMTKNDETYNNPLAICDRINYIQKLKQFEFPMVKHVTIMKGKDFNNLPDEEKYGHCVKHQYGSGSSGIIGYNKGYPITKLNDDETYCVEKIINNEKGKNIAYEAIMLITWNKKKNKSEISMSLHRNFWEDRGFGTVTTCPNAQIDNTHYYHIKSQLEDLVNVLGIKEGLLEPEFLYDLSTNNIILWDLNPRWSLDHTTIGQRAKAWLPKNFDMLNYAVNKKSFFKYYEKQINKGYLKSGLQTWGKTIVEKD